MSCDSHIQQPKQRHSDFPSPHTACACNQLALTRRAPETQNESPHISPSWTKTISRKAAPSASRWSRPQRRLAAHRTLHAAVTMWTLSTCNIIPTNGLVQSRPVKVKADVLPSDLPSLTARSATPVRQRQQPPVIPLTGGRDDWQVCVLWLLVDFMAAVVH